MYKIYYIKKSNKYFVKNRVRTENEQKKKCRTLLNGCLRHLRLTISINTYKLLIITRAWILILI